MSRAADVEDVDVVFDGGVAALDGVRLAVARGELVAIIGPSGCGKSTLLRVLAGLIEPSAGTVRVDGTPPAVARRTTSPIGIVFQQPRLLAWRTVARNVELPLELGGTDAAERARRSGELLATLGLAEFATAYPYALSGGMRMRAAVARALAPEPALLLLDEPFGALDELTRERLQEELRALHGRRRFTAVLVTHAVSEAVFLADRIVVMSPRPGRIIAEVAVPFGARTTSLRTDPEFGRLVSDVSARLRTGAA
jgi:NitT/TauT family transport system ATP-binding protein